MVYVGFVSNLKSVLLFAIGGAFPALEDLDDQVALQDINYRKQNVPLYSLS